MKLSQRRAWANALPREASAWAVRHALYTTLVAVCDGRCVGFLELDVKEGRIETLCRVALADRAWYWHHTVDSC